MSYTNLTELRLLHDMTTAIKYFASAVTLKSDAIFGPVPYLIEIAEDK
jgi:hypothetical protein